MATPKVLEEIFFLSALHVFLELWTLTQKLYNDGTGFWPYFAWSQFLLIRYFPSHSMSTRFNSFILFKCKIFQHHLI